MSKHERLFGVFEGIIGGWLLARCINAFQEGNVAWGVIMMLLGVANIAWAIYNVCTTGNSKS